jgi:hypothetical protein
MPTILQGLGWSDGPDAFNALSAEEQLPFVDQFYRPYVAQLGSAGRLYQATFFPATQPNTDESSVIAAPGGPYADSYSANALLDTDHDGVITGGDLTARVNGVRQGARWDALVGRL